MTLNEKFGSDPSSGWSAVSSLPETKAKPEYTFSEIVDKACDELMDRQIKFSIKRILEMEENLSVIERELDEFIKRKAEN